MAYDLLVLQIEDDPGKEKVLERYIQVTVGGQSVVAQITSAQRRVVAERALVT